MVPHQRKQSYQESQTDNVTKEDFRSIDDYFDLVYGSTTLTSKFQYFLVVLSLAIANSSDATEILFISFTLSDPDFQSSILKNDMFGNGGRVAASVFTGMLLGGGFVGMLSDKFGRKPTLLFGLLLNAVAGALSAVSPNMEFLVVVRFVAGIGIGASVPPLFTLISELSPSLKRGEFVTYVASFWMVGSLYVALVAMFILSRWGWGWRIFATACALPSFVGFFMVMFLVPESPRFFAISGKYMEATANANILAHKMGYSRMRIQDFGLTIEDIEHNFDSLNISSEDGDNLNLDSNTSKWDEMRKSYMKLFAPHMRRISFSLHFIWFSLSFGSYGLIIWINDIFTQVSPNSAYVNAIIFAFAGLPGNIFSAIYLDRIGRTTMLALSMLLSAASLGCFAFYASIEHRSSTGIIIAAFLFQAFSTSAWNTIDLLSSELFPTPIRSTGLGSCTAIGRIGAMIAQPINGMLISRPVMLLGLGGISMFSGGVILLLCQVGDLTGKPLVDDVNKKDEQFGIAMRENEVI